MTDETKTDASENAETPTLAGPISVTVGGKEYVIYKITARHMDAAQGFTKELQRAHRRAVAEIKEDGGDPEAELAKAKDAYKKAAEAKGETVTAKNLEGVTLGTTDASAMSEFVAKMIGKGVDADDLYDNEDYKSLQTAAETLMHGIGSFFQSYDEEQPEVKK